MVKLMEQAATAYHGRITNTDRWSAFRPRADDVLICTPPKSGTTWTQSIVRMLLTGRTDLGGQLSKVSPWIDAEFEPVEEMAARIETFTERRVVKTHTPADGFPVWDGVSLICVYRHPLDVFFSLRNHIMNVKGREGHIMRGPVAPALAEYIDLPLDTGDFDRDSLATVSRHYRETALSGRWPGALILHYTDMLRDPGAAVARIDGFLGTQATAAYLDAVTAATSLSAMKAKAETFAPEGGRGFWENDAGFFHGGGTEQWAGKVSDEMLARYAARMRELLPESAIGWLEAGGDTGPKQLKRG